VTYFPCYDANGNITDYVTTNGTVVAHREYDAFGNTVVATGPLVHDLRHWFSTKYLDEETGLYYYGQRYCSPRLARWLSRDPIGEAGGTCLYRFVGNTPLARIDPDGRITRSVCHYSGKSRVVELRRFSVHLGNPFTISYWTDPVIINFVEYACQCRTECCREEFGITSWQNYNQPTPGGYVHMFSLPTGLGWNEVPGSDYSVFQTVRSETHFAAFADYVADTATAFGEVGSQAFALLFKQIATTPPRFHDGLPERGDLVAGEPAFGAPLSQMNDDIMKHLGKRAGALFAEWLMSKDLGDVDQEDVWKAIEQGKMTLFAQDCAAECKAKEGMPR
jgi:RHS repeat-associated protein